MLLSFRSRCCWLPGSQIRWSRFRLPLQLLLPQQILLRLPLLPVWSEEFRHKPCWHLHCSGLPVSGWSSAFRLRSWRLPLQSWCCCSWNLLLSAPCCSFRRLFPSLLRFRWRWSRMLYTGNCWSLSHHNPLRYARFHRMSRFRCARWSLRSLHPLPEWCSVYLRLSWSDSCCPCMLLSFRSRWCWLPGSQIRWSRFRLPLQLPHLLQNRLRLLLHSDWSALFRHKPC